MTDRRLQPRTSESVVAHVRVVSVRDVKPGNVIWAHNDNDWLKIREVEVNSYGDVIFYRRDGSEASFSSGQKVLVLQ